MDSNRQSWSPDNPDANPSFRKRSNYAASRKYRRHPSMSGSSSDGSPKQARSPSPDLSREDYTKSSDDGWKKKNDGRELEKDYCCSRTDKGGGDSYRHSEKQSVGSSHHHRKHDDYSRDHRHANAGERNYNRSSHSGRESRTDRRSDSRRESEYERSRDHRTDKYSQDKSYNKECRTKGGDSVALEHQKYNDSSDRAVSGRGQSNSVSEEIKTRERDSHRRSSGDYKASGTLSNEESRGHGKSFTSKGTDGIQLKETSKSHTKELSGQEVYSVEKKKHEDREADRHVDRYKRDPMETDHRSSSYSRKRESQDEKKSHDTRAVGEDHDSSSKKLKMVNSTKSTGELSSKFSSRADERLPCKQVQESVSINTSEHVHSSSTEAEGGQDLHAAKVAAMKAAELVNLNLKGSGYMSTDQKKKLLWGSKKTNVAEESGNRWDMSLFPDKERQEKFYKLMSLRLPWYLWPIVGCERRTQSRAQARRERWQWSPPSREAARAPVGFREAVYCRPPTKGRSYCWSWSIIVTFTRICTLTMPENILFALLLCFTCMYLCDIMFCCYPIFRSLQKIC